MNRRLHLIDVIHGLARDEGTRQPSAGEWLAELDSQAEEATKASKPLNERTDDGTSDDSERGGPPQRGPWG